MRMSRRFFIVIAMLVVVLAAKVHNQAQAAERLDVQTIKWALRVSEEENHGFVENVVYLMEKGRISRKIVTIAFIKARKRVKHKFQYFKFAMINLAAREGVKLQ